MTLMDRNILLRTGEFYADIAAAYDEMKYSVVSAVPVSAPGWYHVTFSPFFFIYVGVLFVSHGSFVKFGKIVSDMNPGPLDNLIHNAVVIWSNLIN